MRTFSQFHLLEDGLVPTAPGASSSGLSRPTANDDDVQLVGEEMRCRRARSNRRVLQVSKEGAKLRWHWAIVLPTRGCVAALRGVPMLCLDRAAQAKSWSSSAAFSSPQRKIGMWGSP